MRRGGWLCIFSSRKQKGFLLTELIISITILLMVMPVMFGSYLQIQKNIAGVYSRIVTENEKAYVLSFLKNDLKHSRNIVFFGQDKLEFENLDDDYIKYFIKNNRLGRKKNNSTFYLHEPMAGFLVEKVASQDLQVKLEFEDEIKELRVWGVNII
jgi:hypothetical protein